MRSTIMKKWPLIFCWLVGAPSIAFALLIIVPAPTYYLWMVAVAASEWSLSPESLKQNIMGLKAGATWAIA